MNLTLQHHDVLVITSKIVSKAEGCVVNLSDVEPTDDALRYAKITGKDPRVVELVLRDSHAVSRAAKNVLVVEHRLGFVCANAGIDQSNVEGDDETVLLLPIDPDGTAASIHDVLRQRYDVEVGVIISDSHGRPFRLGTVGVAIGVAGMPGMLDLRGQTDLYGRELKISIQGYADLVASAAQLATGEGAEGRPVVLVRGLSFTRTDGNAAELNRPVQEDLYR
jgi:coenzyme F420-0:L-glutamate ligase/coenzyme F420-1:gamma-L-glutamate ligase